MALPSQRTSQGRRFRRIFRKTGRSLSGSGKRANLLFFRPIRRKRIANGRAKQEGIIPYIYKICSQTGVTLRVSDAPESVAGQGFARSAAAPRQAVRRKNCDGWTGLSRSGKRFNLLFLCSIFRNLILSDCTKIEDNDPKLQFSRHASPSTSPRAGPSIRRASASARDEGDWGIWLHPHHPTPHPE